MPLLEVKDLQVKFLNQQEPSLNGVSFDLSKGEILGLLGESGSGKSLTALALMGLLFGQAEVRGQIYFKEHLLAPADFAKLRGKKIALILQEPMTSLHPIYTVYKQMQSVLDLHRPELNPSEKTSLMIELLERMRLPAPKRILTSYPFELSGGMQQRVAIAMAMACQPDLLIADEPTTALDVTVQAEIMDLFLELRDQTGLSLIFISHDLALIHQTCDRVAVMAAGEIKEIGSTSEVFSHPQHSYTQGLLAESLKLQTSYRY